jgi:hypothetical protein
MKLLLVSGPPNTATVAAGLTLMKKGYCVYFAQPVRLDLSPYGPILNLIGEDTQWKGRWNVNDIEMIKRVDGVYMCKGWTNEPICNVHMQCAKNGNKQLFFEGVTEPRD